jgi:hypothetical protein
VVVSQLKGRLEEAGYLCWMDVGQMGGGQELYSKIDIHFQSYLESLDQDFLKYRFCTPHDDRIRILQVLIL